MKNIVKMTIFLAVLSLTGCETLDTMDKATEVTFNSAGYVGENVVMPVGDAIGTSLDVADSIITLPLALATLPLVPLFEPLNEAMAAPFKRREAMHKQRNHRNYDYRVYSSYTPPKFEKPKKTWGG